MEIYEKIKAIVSDFMDKCGEMPKEVTLNMKDFETVKKQEWVALTQDSTELYTEKFGGLWIRRVN